MRSRRSLMAAAIAALVVSVVPSGATHAAPITLQPGALHRTTGGQCTLNFVFDGVGANAGRTFLGTAAHCVGYHGQRAYDAADEPFGTVVFIGDADRNDRDYAFIEVYPADLGRVSAAVKGHPEYPTGATDVAAQAAVGDLVQFSGFALGYAWTQPTQEQRRGVLGATGPPVRDASTWGAYAPVHWGDSGGPVLHVETGTALGINSRLCSGTCSVTGPTVAHIVADAAVHGFGVSLRTVGGPA